MADLGNPGAREFFLGTGDWPFRGFVVRRGREVFAYANVCPHRRHPLNLAEDDFLISIEGRGALLRCASHGALFVPENGLCIAGPCAGHALDALECGVAADVVWVRVPETAGGAPEAGG